MTKKKDPRRNINAPVHAKATSITSLAECARLFGSLAKQKLLNGIVQEVVVDRSGSRAKTILEVEWCIKTGLKKRKALNIISVYKGHVPEASPDASNGTGATANRGAEEQYSETVRRLALQDSSDQDEDASKEGSVETRGANTAITIPPSPDTVAHDFQWFREDVSTPIGGPVSRTPWSVRTHCGEVIREGAGGGNWIDIGLPQYVAIDRKPENGCEIQNAACGRSGIMLHLELVSTAEDEATRQYEGECLHGTAVLRRVTSPWAGSHRIICADSYFASVDAADAMQQMGLKFIGVIKTATTKYPLKYLSQMELQDRGDWVSLVRRGINNNVDMMAVMWMDRERRYFVSNTSSTLEAAPYTRIRWRQLEDGPARVELNIPQPKVSEMYYSACAQIDRHNRSRQDDLMLERKIRTLDWSFRVNSSILGIIIVDAWKLYSGERGVCSKMSQREFYETLSMELILNNYDGIGLRRSYSNNVMDVESLTPQKRSSGVGTHLTPTKKRRKLKDGTPTTYALQNNCRVCTKKTIHICSTCSESGGAKDLWLCHTSTKRECFLKHLHDVHE